MDASEQLIWLGETYPDRWFTIAEIVAYTYKQFGHITNADTISTRRAMIRRTLLKIPNWECSITNAKFHVGNSSRQMRITIWKYNIS